MKTPLTKNLIIKHVGESAVTFGNEYPYPAARPIILDAIQGPNEPPTLLCWTGKGYERLMPIADITDPTNITGCALKFDSTLDYIDVYKLASIDPDRLDVSDGKLIGAEFAYEGRADVNDTQALLLSFGSEGGGGGTEVVPNPEDADPFAGPFLSSIGIGGTSYIIREEPPSNYNYTISDPIAIDPLIKVFQPSETLLTDFDSEEADHVLVDGGKVVVEARLMFGDEGEETTINTEIWFDDEVTFNNNNEFLYSDVEVILPDYYCRFKASLNMGSSPRLTLYPTGPIQYYEITIAGLDFTTAGLGSGWDLHLLAPKHVLDAGFKELGATIDYIQENWSALIQSASTLQGFLRGASAVWDMGYQVKLTSTDAVIKPVSANFLGAWGVPGSAGSIATIFDNNDVVSQFSGTDFDYTIRYFMPTPEFI